MNGKNWDGFKSFIFSNILDKLYKLLFFLIKYIKSALLFKIFCYINYLYFLKNYVKVK